MILKLLEYLYKTFVLFFLIFSLLLTSMPNTFAQETCSYDDDPAMALEQANCATSTDKQWDCKLNRCVTKQQVTDMRSSYQKCASMPQETAEENLAKRNCFNSLALEYTDLEVIKSDSKLDRLRGGMSAANTALTVINIAAFRGKIKLCPSNIVFLAAAIGGLGAELYVGYKINRDLKDYQKQYEKIVVDSYNAQLESFEYLRAQQQLVHEAAGKKKTIYTVLTVAYAIAAAVALLEVMGVVNCMRSGKATQAAEKARDTLTEMDDMATEADALMEGADAGIEDVGSEDVIGPTSGYLPNDCLLQKSQSPFQDFINRFLIPPVFAADKSTKPLSSSDLVDAAKTPVIPMLFGITAGLVLSFVAPLRKFFSSSFGVLIMSGISGVLSYMTIEEMKDQEDAAERNIAALEEVISQMKNDMQLMCPNTADWDDLSKPLCYCYTANGEKNTERTASNTCQDVWKKNGENYYVDPTKYIPQSATRQSCFDSNGEYDAECNCLKTSSCYQSSFSSTNLGIANTKSTLKPIEDELNKYTKGDFESTDVNSSAFKQSAANADNLTKALFGRYEKAQEKQGNFNSLPFQDDAYMKRQVSSIGSPIANKLSGIAGTRVDLPELNLKSLKEAQAQLDGKKAEYEGGDKKTAPKNKNIISGINLGSRGSEVVNFQGSEYEKAIKNSDITFDNEIEKDTSLSIWEILSHRYIVSGLRRLFSDDNEESK